MRIQPREMKKTRIYPLTGSLFAPQPGAKNSILGYSLSLASACNTRGAPKKKKSFYSNDLKKSQKRGSNYISKFMYSYFLKLQIPYLLF